MNKNRILIETPKLALTRVEAADALNISPATLDRLTQRGLLHPSRALRRPLYAVDELKRFLTETTGSTATDAQSPDRSGEVFDYLRDSEPHRKNEYDGPQPVEGYRAR
jgi:hypothetical protein